MHSEASFGLAALLWPDWHPQHSISCISSNWNGSIVATGTHQGYIVLWNRQTYHTAEQQTTPSLTPSFFLFSHWTSAPPVLDCTFASLPTPKLQSSSTEILVSLHGDNTLRYWSLQDGRCMNVLEDVVRYKIYTIRSFANCRFLLLTGIFYIEIFDIWTQDGVCALRWQDAADAPADAPFSSQSCSVAVSHSVFPKQMDTTLTYPMKHKENRQTPLTETVNPSHFEGVVHPQNKDASTYFRDSATPKHIPSIRRSPTRFSKWDSTLQRYSSNIVKASSDDRYRNIGSTEGTNAHGGDGSIGSTAPADFSQCLVACLFQTGRVVCWDVSKTLRHWEESKKVCGAAFDGTDLEHKAVAIDSSVTSKNAVTYPYKQHLGASDESVPHEEAKREQKNWPIYSAGTAVVAVGVDPFFISDVCLDDPIFEVEHSGKSTQLSLSPNFLFLIAKARLIVWKRVENAAFEPLIDLFCPNVCLNGPTGASSKLVSTELPYWVGLQIVNWSDYSMLNAIGSASLSSPGKGGTHALGKDGFERGESFLSSLFSSILVVWTSEGLVASYYFSQTAVPSTRAKFHLSYIPQTCLEGTWRVSPFVVADASFYPEAIERFWEAVEGADTEFNKRDTASAHSVDAFRVHECLMSCFDIRFYYMDSLKEDALRSLDLPRSHVGYTCFHVHSNLRDVWKMQHSEREQIYEMFRDCSKHRYSSGDASSRIREEPKISDRASTEGVLPTMVTSQFVMVGSEAFLILSFSDGVVAALCLNCLHKDMNGPFIRSKFGQYGLLLPPDNALRMAKTSQPNEGAAAGICMEGHPANPAGPACMAYPNVPFYRTTLLPSPIRWSPNLRGAGEDMWSADATVSEKGQETCFYTVLSAISNGLLAGGTNCGDITLWNMPEFEVVCHLPGCHISSVHSIRRVRNLNEDFQGEVEQDTAFFLSIDCSDHCILFDSTDYCYTYSYKERGGVRNLAAPTERSVHPSSLSSLSSENDSPSLIRSGQRIPCCSSLFTLYRIAPHVRCPAYEISSAFIDFHADLLYILTADSLFLWKVRSGRFMRSVSKVVLKKAQASMDLEEDKTLLMPASTTFLQTLEASGNDMPMQKAYTGFVCGSLRVTSCIKLPSGINTYTLSTTDPFGLNEEADKGLLHQKDAALLSRTMPSCNMHDDVYQSGSISIMLLELGSFVDWLANRSKEASVSGGLPEKSWDEYLPYLPLCSLFFPFALSSSFDRIAFNHFPFISRLKLPLTIAILGVNCALSIPIASTLQKQTRAMHPHKLITHPSDHRLSSVLSSPSNSTPLNNIQDTSRLPRNPSYLKERNKFYYSTSLIANRIYDKNFCWRSRMRHHSSPTCGFRRSRLYHSQRKVQFKEDSILDVKHRSNTLWLDKMGAQWPYSPSVITLNGGVDVFPGSVGDGLLAEKDHWMDASRILPPSIPMEPVDVSNYVSPQKICRSHFAHKQTTEQLAVSCDTNTKPPPTPFKTKILKPQKKWLVKFSSFNHTVFFGHSMWKSPFALAILALFMDALAAVSFLDDATSPFASQELRELLITEILAAAPTNGICLSLLAHIMLQLTHPVMRDSAEYILRTCIHYTTERNLRTYVKACFNVLRDSRLKKNTVRIGDVRNAPLARAPPTHRSTHFDQEEQFPVLLQSFTAEGVKMIEVVLVILSIVVFERPCHANRLGLNFGTIVLQYLLSYHLYHRAFDKKAYLFCKLLADGCEILWKPHVFKMKSIVSIFKSVLEKAEHDAIANYAASFASSENSNLLWCIFEVFNNYQLIYFSKPCARILEAISREEPGLIIQAMGFAARRPDREINYNTSALFLLLRLTNRDPVTMRHYLNDIAQVITSCLDPADVSRRRNCLPAATSFLFQLVKHFPMIAFHQASQRLAIGGPSTFITLYDLRTATMWRILEGHTGLINGLEFSDDGSLLGSYSAEECLFCLWQTVASGFFGGIFGISGTYEKSVSLKSIKFPLYSDTKLKNIRIQYKSPSEWMLRREDGRNYLIVFEN